MTARSDEGVLTLHDVLWGAVWVCSGQSNMAFTMAVPAAVLNSAESSLRSRSAGTAGTSSSWTRNSCGTLASMSYPGSIMT